MTVTTKKLRVILSLPLAFGLGAVALVKDEKHGAVGTFDGTFSGMQLEAYSDASISNLSNGAGGFYTVTYSAASPGKTLSIKYIFDRVLDNDGNVTLQAPALTAPGAKNPSATSITRAGDSANFSTTDNESVTAAAADTGGTVARVEVFAGDAKLGESASSDYEIFLNATGATLWEPSIDLTPDSTVAWAHWRTRNSSRGTRPPLRNRSATLRKMGRTTFGNTRTIPPLSAETTAHPPRHVVRRQIRAVLNY